MTWLELFAAFDIGGYRKPGGQSVIDQDSTRRAKARRCKLKRRAPRSQRATNADCSVKLPLRAELDNVKAIFRSIIRNETDPAHANLFVSSRKVKDRRLQHLAILGNQPAIEAMVSLEREMATRIAIAIAKQRNGASTCHLVQQQAELYQPSGIRIKWANLHRIGH